MKALACSASIMSQLFAQFLLQVWLEVHHGMNLLRTVSQQTLEITDEPVDVSFPRCFENDVLVVVISETSGEFLVVHLRFVLPDAPPPRHLVRVRHLELPAVSGPADEGLAGLVRQELQQELPQLDGPRAREAGPARGLRYDGSLHQRTRAGGLQTGGGGHLSLQEGGVVVHGNVGCLERL